MGAEALSTTTYIQNRSPTNAVHKITPYEVWTGDKVKVKHLRLFDWRMKERKLTLKLRKASSSDIGLALGDIDFTTLKN